MSVFQDGTAPNLVVPPGPSTPPVMNFCGHVVAQLPVDKSSVPNSIRSDPLPGFVQQTPPSEDVIPYRPVPVAVLAERQSAVRFADLPPAAPAPFPTMKRSVSVCEMRAHAQEHPNKEVLSHKTVRFEVPRPQTPAMEFQPPEPIRLEEGGEKYGMRCVCGQKENGGVLVLCDKCGYWLHGLCVGIARARDEPFYCPFCLRRAIRCKCGDDRRYDHPIVQCANCKFWVHKECENLGWGIVPPAFTCSRCKGTNFTLPHVRPEFMSLNRMSFVNCDRYEVVKRVPDGQFRNFLFADLNKTELSFYDTISRYFHSFTVPLFERNHEFWKIFVDSMISLLGSTKQEILNTVDLYATTLLYAPLNKKIWPDECAFGMSENAMVSFDPDSVKEVDAKEKACYRTADRRVHVKEALEEDDFILDLPGFLMITNEVNADEGISPYCIRLLDTDLVVDMERTKFEFAPYLKRSFHYNCYAKLYKKDGNVRVGLFATRTRGPIPDHKRSPAIPADGILSLPLDGGLPYPLPKCEWKVMRQKHKTSKARTKNQPRSDVKLETSVQLSLLSAFCEDIVPPLPFNLVSDKESQIRSHVSSMVRERTRKRHRGSDEE